MDILGKSCLVIGSGADLVGRSMASAIDGGQWDIVVRCNERYGAPADVGSRTDLIFVRWTAWLRSRFKDCPHTPAVIVNEHRGISAKEMDAAAREIDASRASIGLLACAWLLNRFASSVSVIGFGFSGSGFALQKTYPGGRIDSNTHYNWPAEHKWLSQWVSLIP